MCQRRFAVRPFRFTELIDTKYTLIQHAGLVFLCIVLKQTNVPIDRRINLRTSLKGMSFTWRFFFFSRELTIITKMFVENDTFLLLGAFSKFTPMSTKLFSVHICPHGPLL